jgi:hypothetical protein
VYAEKQERLSPLKVFWASVRIAARTQIQSLCTGFPFDQADVGVAEKTQVVPGFDYAWLDEATYFDWLRYHSLIDGGLHIVRPTA